MERSRRGLPDRLLLLPSLTLVLLYVSGALSTPTQAQQPGSLDAIGSSGVSGSWTGTWTRHDTGDFGGFTLVIGERDGQPYATFLGQEAIAISISADAVTMTLEPASECQGAHLRFSFDHGQPVGGSYSTYGGCSRTGTYTFDGTAQADAEDEVCPPFESRPGVLVLGCLVIISAPPEGVLELSRTDLPVWVRDRIVTVGATAVCVGAIDTVVSGDATVLLEGSPIARLGDTTAHGGVLVSSAPQILVNGEPAATIADMHTCPAVDPGPVPHVGGPINSLGGDEEEDTQE